MVDTSYEVRNREKIESPVKAISPNEAVIIQMVRSLNPFERLEIVADKLGKVNHFLIHKSSKVLLTDREPMRVV